MVFSVETISSRKRGKPIGTALGLNETSRHDDDISFLREKRTGLYRCNFSISVYFTRYCGTGNSRPEPFAVRCGRLSGVGITSLELLADGQLLSNAALSFTNCGDWPGSWSACCGHNPLCHFGVARLRINPRIICGSIRHNILGAYSCVLPAIGFLFSCWALGDLVHHAYLGMISQLVPRQLRGRSCCRCACYSDSTCF